MTTASGERIGAARYALLLAALVAPSFNFVALPPVLPDIAAAFGGGARGQGVAQAAQALPFLGLAVGGLFAGWSLVRLGARLSIAVAGTGLVVAGAGGMLSDGAAALLTSCALIGLMAALATSALAALTSESVDGARRDRLLGVQVAVSDVCTVAGGVAAAVLAARFGWHGPFAIFAAFGLFLLAFLAPARVPDLGVGAGGGGLVRMLALAWPVYLAAAIVFFLVATQATQLPFYLQERGYRTASGRALFTTFGIAAAMCGSVSFALLMGRVAAWRVQALAIASAAAGALGLSFWSGDLGIGLASVFLIGLGSGLVIPTLFADALRSAPEGLRGHSIGLLNVAIFAGSFISPLLLSPVAASLGYPGLYAAIAAAVVLVGLPRALAERTRARSREPFETEREKEVASHG